MAGPVSLISQILMKLGSFIEEDIKTFIFSKVEMKKLKSDLEIIEPFIEAAERQQLGTQKPLRVWLRNLKHICYDIEDAVDEWDSRILKMKLEQQEAERNASKREKVRLSMLYPFRRVGLYAKISHRIKVRKEELDKVDEQTRRYITHLQPVMAIQNNQLDQAETTPYHSNIVVPVRKREKNRLITMLFAENRQLPTPTVVSIIGPGGIGKSTLAKEAYHDSRVKGGFDKMVWVWVSKHFDMRRIAEEIVAAIEGRTPEITSLAQLLEKVEKCVEGKNVLLVLDNVWIEHRHDNETSITDTSGTRSSVQLRNDTNHWFQLKNCLICAASRSKILITTRSSEAAKDLGSEETNRLLLEQLSDRKSEELFEAIAFVGKTATKELRTTGKKIASKCKGLPLAINCLAKLCRCRPENEWERILESPMWNQEEVEQDVFRPLMISYCYLEPSIRRCLLYCAIFPKGSHIQKEKLIKLWMAQGFLQPKGNTTMETIGLGYFNYLKAHHFFQNSKSLFRKPKDCSYKMHDIVHDFITYLSIEMEEYFTLEGIPTNRLAVGYKERVRYSQLWLKSKEAPPAQLYDCKRLRSLMVKWSGEWLDLRSLMVKCSTEWLDFLTFNIKEYDAILHQACENLPRLRALSLSIRPLSFKKGISRDIGKLILLRYLDLSDCQLIFELPQGICDLINLQTLDISRCSSLFRLPDRIGDLTNLIYLLNSRTDKLQYIPKGIRRLTKLQTLSEFVVGNGENAASLKDLGYLTNLQGKLKVRGLSNVDVKQAVSLMGKVSWNSIVNLSLSFANSHTDGSVLEVVKAPESLEELKICGYGGRCLSQIPLSKALRKLRLKNCTELEQLPPLGQLPSLEILMLGNLPKVRKIGVEVLGIEGEGHQDFIAFPRLQCLRINDLKGWEEWNFEILNTSNNDNSSRTIRIMPCLRFLHIYNCNSSITALSVPPQILGLESLEAFSLNYGFIYCNPRRMHEDRRLFLDKYPLSNFKILFEFMSTMT